MNSSDNFGLNLPEQTDSYDVEHMNENTRAIDTLLNERMALKTITVNTDLNRMLESGIYYLPQNNTYTNMPPSCTNGWLIVMKNDGNVKQVFLRRGSASTHSNAYSRLLSGTGDLIGDWVRYLSELELGLFTDLELDPQATNVVQALNDLYSYCVNQFASKNHTHNYAGSSSAGGSATSAVKLQNARTIQTNLQSTSTASFDGTANITPGVTGVLPVANGGTGQTTLIDAEKALLTSLPTDTSSDMMDDHSFIPTLDQQSGSGLTWYTPRKRPFSRIWTYIQNKISSVLGLSTSGYTGNSASASKLNLPSTTYGSQTQPVYFTNGKPAACSYFISKSVPSDAKFTDTVYTHPTSSGNKHIPSGGSSGKLLRWNSDGTAEWSGATNGSATQPIYMNGGVPTACTYTLGKSVPSNAVFTDTNTWRPVQNNLTSTSTSDCLSANQGKLLNERVQLLENADKFKLTNNSYIKIKGNVVTLYSYGGASTTSALNSIKLQSKYRPPYPIHIAGYLCKVGAISRYPAYLSIGSDGVMGVYFINQFGGDAIYHNGTDYWFDGCGTWLNQTS